MPSVLVPAEFFRKERNTVYGNWRTAFWRELFQNSVDAGASRIDIQLTAIESEKCNILFADDGCGMTRKVLDEVYFQLGKSTKGSDTIGGFGRARILTCFSMDWYKIRSFDYEVHGEGAHYDIENHSHTPGCEVEVGCDAPYDGVSYAAMLPALKQYLADSNLHCEVVINGKVHTPLVEEAEHIKNLEYKGEQFAMVLKGKPGPDRRYGVFVRVNGTLMHVRNISGQHRIFIEIHPDKSRKVLTASRDSLMDEYRPILDAYIAEINSTSRAVRNEFKMTKTRFKGSGLVRSFRKSMAVRKEWDVEDLLDVQLSVMSVTDLKDKLAALNVDNASPDVIERIRQKIADAEYASKHPFPDMMMLVESYDEKVRHAATTTWDPATWRWHFRAGQVKWDVGGTRARLMMAWQICCNHAVNAYLEWSGNDELAWGIGWYFGDDKAHYVGQGNEHYFLINPLDENAEPRYTFRERGSLKSLMSSAKHEVAHVTGNGHDERFASAMTGIDARFSEWEVLPLLISTKA